MLADAYNSCVKNTFSGFTINGTICVLITNAKVFEGYVFTCVCHSVKGCLPQFILRYTTPNSRHPLGSRHLPAREANALPRRQTHPQEADTSQPGKQTPSPEGRHIPRKLTPPQEADTPPAVHAGRYGQQVGGMHPTGMPLVMSLLLDPVLYCCLPSDLFHLEMGYWYWWSIRFITLDITLHFKLNYFCC